MTFYNAEVPQCNKQYQSTEERRHHTFEQGNLDIWLWEQSEELYILPSKLWIWYCEWQFILCNFQAKCMHKHILQLTNILSIHILFTRSAFLHIRNLYQCFSWNEDANCLIFYVWFLDIISHLVLGHCWLGDRKGIWPVKSWVLLCWWWLDWSFARLTAPVVTTRQLSLQHRP